MIIRIKGQIMIIRKAGKDIAVPGQRPLRVNSSYTNKIALTPSDIVHAVPALSIERTDEV